MNKVYVLLGKITLSLLFLLSSFFAGYYIFKERSTELAGASLTKFADAEYEFYLRQADPFISFYIEGEPGADPYSLFTLLDDDGVELRTEAKRLRQGQARIFPPTGGYEPGERYVLELEREASFSGAELAGVRTLVFSVKREQTEEYTLTDAATLVTGEALQAPSDNEISLPSGQWAAGDIIVGVGANGEYEAYKISQLVNEAAGQAGQSEALTAVVETPGLDEIFADLQLYREVELDIADITRSPDIHSEVVENVRSSGFFNALIMRAYAEGNAPDKKDTPIEVSFESKDDGLKISVTLTLKAGDKGLFGLKALQHTDVKITLSALLAMSVVTDINGVTQMEVTNYLKTTFSFKVTISPQEEKYDRTLQDIFHKKNYTDLTAYKEYVNTIVDSLVQISNDGTQGEIKLFDWSVPMPGIPFVSVGAEVKLFAKFGMAGELVLGNDYSYTVVSGLMFQRGQFRPHFRIDKNDVDRKGALSAKGKADVKAGIKLVLKMAVINERIASIHVDPQAGVYGEFFLTWPILTPEELTKVNPLYMYAEGGLYAEVNFKANIHFLFSKWKFEKQLKEHKLTTFQYGNYKIPRGLNSGMQTVKLLNNRGKLPEMTFAYYDVNKAAFANEQLDARDVRFIVAEGSGLRIEDDDIVADSGTSGSRISFVTAVYKHTDGQNYSTIFKALTSGSMLEGKVSAYAEDASATEIAGAAVALFAAGDMSAPISTVVTDEAGKFSFTVDQGEFTLVISASGYRTLTSSQTVAKDEIKFTEHILLMDDGQSGAGTAAGIVKDALDGKTLADVTIRLRPNWNNRSGEYVSEFVTATSPDGGYTISGLPVGYYTIEAGKQGYYTDYRNITVRSDSPKLDHNFTLSPILPEDQIRIVLRWGERPADLDSHLIGQKPDGSEFRVYYSNKRYSYGGQEAVNLDVDDTTSYGPETITLLRPVDGRTVYAVHDFTNRGDTNSDRLSYSEAVVSVFKGGRQIATYHVPTGQTGVYWVVFALEADGIPIPINTVTNIIPQR